jgi:hypothetical protein
MFDVCSIELDQYAAFNSGNAHVVVQSAARRRPKMNALTVQAEVTADHMLGLEIPCDIPPGQVEVELTIQPHHPSLLANDFSWGHLRVLGRDVWAGVDANTYVQDLRADREAAK